ncbi:hypothetical protein ABIB96_001282 [Bradyrhizobium sp. LA3.X]|uniref:hypothetical protein n=1 Tax=unclassified Bradyrhizobium TaxID=2631580 RepID=UPI0033990A08
MVGRISDDPDKVISGSEKVAAADSGQNYGIILTTIAAWLASLSQTITNKAINATNNTITNLTTAMFASSVVDTDGTLAANSDTRIASQKAVKAYADARIAAQDAMVFKGVTDCSGNPNYPAADRGHTYRVSVAGKIGGASGVVVEVGDMFICLTDGTASGNHATVGAQWSIIQANIDGAVTGPASSTSGNIATFNGTTGKVVQDGGAAISTDGTFASNSDAKVPTEKAVKTYVDGGAWTAYTPTVSAQTPGGTPPTFSSISGRYRQVGKTVHVQVNVGVTTAGTGTGGVVISLPVALKVGFNGGLSGALAAGVTVGAVLNQGNLGNNVVILKYDGTTVITNGQAMSASGTYEAA